MPASADFGRPGGSVRGHGRKAREDPAQPAGAVMEAADAVARDPERFKLADEAGEARRQGSLGLFVWSMVGESAVHRPLVQGEDEVQLANQKIGVGGAQFDVAGPRLERGETIPRLFQFVECEGRNDLGELCFRRREHLDQGEAVGGATGEACGKLAEFQQ